MHLDLTKIKKGFENTTLNNQVKTIIYVTPQISKTKTLRTTGYVVLEPSKHEASLSETVGLEPGPLAV